MLPQIGKWYTFFEMHNRPGYYVSGFKPTFFFGICKWLDFGEPGMINGAKKERAGFWCHWTVPIGIDIHISILR